MNCLKCGKVFQGNSIYLHLKYSEKCSIVTNSFCTRGQESTMSDVASIFSEVIPEDNVQLLQESFTPDERRKLLDYQDNLHRLYCTTIEAIHNTHFYSKVKTTSGVFKEGDRRVYLDILLFASQRVKLSEQDCTALLGLLKRISSTVYGADNEIALPSRCIIKTRKSYTITA